MGEKWSTLEALKFIRHDWLNKIQLIKGNLSLNRMDRVNEIIDEIVTEARNESLLSNLNIPELAIFLISYNWENFMIQLNYEVLEYELEGSFQVDDIKMTEWIRSFLETLESSVDENGNHTLFIVIRQEQKGIRFFFDFRGIITKQQLVNDFLNGTVPFDIEIQEQSEQTILFELYLPYLV